MRTFEFTEVELSLIKRALGIAEKSMFDLKEQYLKTVVNVRGSNVLLNRKEVDAMFNLENEFCDLLLKIENIETE